MERIIWLGGWRCVWTFSGQHWSTTDKTTYHAFTFWIWCLNHLHKSGCSLFSLIIILINMYSSTGLTWRINHNESSTLIRLTLLSWSESFIACENRPSVLLFNQRSSSRVERRDVFALIYSGELLSSYPTRHFTAAFIHIQWSVCSSLSLLCFLFRSLFSLCSLTTNENLISGFQLCLCPYNGHQRMETPMFPYRRQEISVRHTRWATGGKTTELYAAKFNTKAAIIQLK